MIVDCMDNLLQMTSMREDWNAAWARDPHSTVFTSWTWMRAWMEVAPEPVHVLAAKTADQAPYTAFWPITMRCGGASSTFRIDQVREIAMGGDPLADDAGMVIPAGLEHEAVQAFGNALCGLPNWDRLSLKDLRDPRMDAVMRHLGDEAQSVQAGEGQCCPCIELPATWERYLRERLSPAFRHALKQKIRRAERTCRVTTLDDAPAILLIDAVMGLALNRMRPHPDPHTFRQRAILEWCATAGLADILVLWRGDVPIGGAAMLKDQKRQATGCILTAFDQRHAPDSPGTVAMALSIKRAIERNFRSFDFLRGDEAYKFRFGAVACHTRNIKAIRRGLQSTTRRTIEGLRWRLGA